MVETETPKAVDVALSKNALSVELSDGRTISVPLDWYPRLVHATEAERANWRLVGKGHGIHWEDIDEDISARGLLAGGPSAESPVIPGELARDEAAVGYRMKRRTGMGR